MTGATAKCGGQQLGTHLAERSQAALSDKCGLLFLGDFFVSLSIVQLIRLSNLLTRSLPPSLSLLEVCAFPPIRQKKANGWGTELIEIHTVRDLVTLAQLERKYFFSGYQLPARFPPSDPTPYNRRRLSHYRGNYAAVWRSHSPDELY